MLVFVRHNDIRTYFFTQWSCFLLRKNLDCKDRFELHLCNVSFVSRDAIGEVRICKKYIKKEHLCGNALSVICCADLGVLS